MLPFLAIVSALAEGANAYSQSVAMKNQGKFAKQIADQNAFYLEKNAADSVDQGNIQANYAQGKTDQLLGSQRSAIADQGLDVNSGIGLALQNDAKLFGANDIATIRTNAYREAYGFKTQALNIKTQAKLDYQAAKFKSKGMLLEGAIKVLSGAGKAL